MTSNRLWPGERNSGRTTHSNDRGFASPQNQLCRSVRWPPGVAAIPAGAWRSISLPRPRRSVEYPPEGSLRVRVPSGLAVKDFQHICWRSDSREIRNILQTCEPERIVKNMPLAQSIPTYVPTGLLRAVLPLPLSSSGARRQIKSRRSTGRSHPNELSRKIPNRVLKWPAGPRIRRCDNPSEVTGH